MDTLVEPNIIRMTEEERPSPQKCLGWIRQNLLLVLTILGVMLGIAFGSAARYWDYSQETVMLVSFPGEIMMRMLKMLILPLIISSIISGLACLDTGSSGKMGSRALLYYFSTTILAAILGITMVTTIHPGNPEIMPSTSEPRKNEVEPQILDALLDIIRNMFPENLIKATFSSTKTIYKLIPDPEANMSSSFPVQVSNPRKEQKVEKVLHDSSGTNVMGDLGYLVELNGSGDGHYEKEYKSELWVKKNVEEEKQTGMIMFCVAFGTIVGQMQESKIMVDFFITLNDVVMKMVEIIMWYSPIGIMCLVIGQIMAIKDLRDTAQMLGMYMLTVVCGLAVHATITLPSIYFLITRKNPAIYFRGMLQAWITALGTGSSSATLPITFRCLEENNKIDKRVTRFILPVGATVNMDGTALYEAVGSIFIAQMYDIALGPGQLLTVSLTSTLASIGAASIPSAGLVTMLLVLTALGLPTEHVSLIFAVDWILDRVRTSINVLGDAFGAGIVAHLCRDELARFESLPEELIRTGSGFDDLPQSPKSVMDLRASFSRKRRSLGFERPDLDDNGKIPKLKAVIKDLKDTETQI